MAFMKLIQGVDYELQQVQNNVKALLDPVASNPLLNGNFIKSVTLSASGLNPVNHGLGRNWVGWVITNQVGGSSVYIVPVDQTMPNKTLVLKCTVNCEVDLYVF